jgi:hypothetical protein
MSLTKYIRAKSSTGPRTATATIGGEEIILSAAGLSWEDRASLLFPNALDVGQLAEGLRAQLNLPTFPDDLVISAQAIIALWPQDDKPTVADLVSFAHAEPGEFASLDYAAQVVLGLVSEKPKRDGRFEWGVAYKACRRAYQILESGKTEGLREAIMEAGLTAKTALRDNEITVPDLDQEIDDPVMETLRGNSGAAPSAGA